MPEFPPASQYPIDPTAAVSGYVSDVQERGHRKRMQAIRERAAELAGLKTSIDIGRERRNEAFETLVRPHKFRQEKAQADIATGRIPFALGERLTPVQRAAEKAKNFQDAARSGNPAALRRDLYDTETDFATARNTVHQPFDPDEGAFLGEVARGKLNTNHPGFHKLSARNREFVETLLRDAFQTGNYTMRAEEARKREETRAQTSKENVRTRVQGGLEREALEGQNAMARTQANIASRERLAALRQQTEELRRRSPGMTPQQRIAAMRSLIGAVGDVVRMGGDAAGALAPYIDGLANLVNQAEVAGNQGDRRGAEVGTQNALGQLGTVLSGARLETRTSPNLREPDVSRETPVAMPPPGPPAVRGPFGDVSLVERPGENPLITNRPTNIPRPEMPPLPPPAAPESNPFLNADGSMSMAQPVRMVPGPGDPRNRLSGLSPAMQIWNRQRQQSDNALVFVTDDRGNERVVSVVEARSLPGHWKREPVAASDIERARNYAPSGYPKLDARIKAIGARMGTPPQATTAPAAPATLGAATAAIATVKERAAAEEKRKNVESNARKFGLNAIKNARNPAEAYQSTFRAMTGYDDPNPPDFSKLAPPDKPVNLGDTTEKGRQLNAINSDIADARKRLDKARGNTTETARIQAEIEELTKQRDALTGASKAASAPANKRELAYEL